MRPTADAARSRQASSDVPAASVPMPTARASCSLTTSGSAERSVPAPTDAGGARLSTKRTPACSARAATRSIVATGSSPCVSTRAAPAMRSRSASTASGVRARFAPPVTMMVFSPESATVICATPVGASAIRATASVGSPNRSRVDRAKSPAASVPMRATKSTDAPTTCAATAWFDPLPPSATWNPCDRIVSPGAGNAAT